MFDDDVVAVMPRLRRYARLLAGSDADDLVQSTVLRALEKRDLFDGSDLRAWMFTIMHNQYVTSVRRSARRGEVMMDGEDLALDGNAGARVLVREVIAEMERLPSSRWRLIMRLAGGASYDEIARHEDIAVGTVRSRISRGRARLREFVA